MANAHAAAAKTWMEWLVEYGMYVVAMCSRESSILLLSRRGVDQRHRALVGGVTESAEKVCVPEVDWVPALGVQS